MISHPYALMTACDLRRNDFLATADRERLAAAACARSAPSLFATIATLAAQASARPVSIADIVMAMTRRALPALASGRH